MPSTVHCTCCKNPVPEPHSKRFVFCNECSHCWFLQDLQAHAQLEKSSYTRDYAGYREDARLITSFQSLLQKVFVPHVQVAGKVLDVGCGGGTFLTVASEAGYSVSGLDISEDAAEICRSKGLNAVAGDFLSFEAETPLDAITFWDVLEHLREPALFLVHGMTLLQSNGVLIVKVPIFGGLSVRLANCFPSLRGVLLGMPEHIQFFSSKSLRAILETNELSYELIPLQGGIRSPATGGSIKKRLARFARTLIAKISGDGNALVVVKKLQTTGFR